MALTKKHFISIAKVINELTVTKVNDEPLINKDELIGKLGTVFKSENPLFNRERFADACNKNKE